MVEKSIYGALGGEVGPIAAFGSGWQDIDALFFFAIFLLPLWFPTAVGMLIGSGIGKVGWHAFRHIYRASLKRCGIPLEVQKDLMRHANVKVTPEVYGLDRELTTAHREANTADVKTLLGE